MPATRTKELGPTCSVSEMAPASVTVSSRRTWPVTSAAMYTPPFEAGCISPVQSRFGADSKIVIVCGKPSGRYGSKIAGTS
jgi:hypothetical protein